MGTQGPRTAKKDKNKDKATTTTRGTPRKRAPYRFVSDATWELVRAAYLGGETAKVVAKRYGVGLSNLRQTSSRKAWTKRAHAEAASQCAAFDAGEPVGGRVSPAALASPAPASPASAPAPDLSSLAPTALHETLLDTVMTRAGQAILRGAGAEASALIRSAREWVLLTGEILATRAELDEIALPAGLSEAQAREVRAQATILDLHGKWTKG